MKKVLVVISTKFATYDGISSSILNFYKNTDKNQYIIDFASTNAILSEELKLLLNENHSKYCCLGERKKNIFIYCYRLNKLLRANNYDVIHINSNSATATIELAIAKLNKIPKRIVHNHSCSCNHKFINWMLTPIFNLLYTKAIACSVSAGNWLFPKNRFQVINNGIDTERYRFSKNNRERIRKRFNINDSAVVLGHVGAIYKPKNHLFLIKVFSEYHQINKNSYLLLVGDGVLRHEVENEISRLKLTESVVLVGVQDKPELFLSAMDYFVFPSLWEGMPLSLIEAQANGLPCFASNNIDIGVKITRNINLLPIDCGSGIWVDYLVNINKEDRLITSNRNIKAINATGFSASENAKIIEKIYS